MSELAKPTPSPWRTDIENATRDGRDILIVCKGNTYVVYPDCGLGNYDWQSNEYCFENENITHWMLLPELQTIMNTDKVFVHGIEYVPKLLIPPNSGELKIGRWKPEIGERYWYVASDGRYAFPEDWSGHNSNQHKYLYGNVYQTEELAMRARDKQLLLVELQDYADQKNAGKTKEESVSHLFHNPMNMGWRSIRLYSNAGMLGTIAFYEDTDLYDAIEHFGKRLDLLL